METHKRKIKHRKRKRRKGQVRGHRHRAGGTERGSRERGWGYSEEGPRGTGGWPWACPPAKLLAQGRDLLPKASGALLRSLHAALQLGVLSQQPAVTELQLLQAAQQVSGGRPGSRKGKVTTCSPSLLPQVREVVRVVGQGALLEKEEQERDCPALFELLAQPLSLTHSPKDPQPWPGPRAGWRAQAGGGQGGARG